MYGASDTTRSIPGVSPTADRGLGTGNNRDVRQHKQNVSQSGRILIKVGLRLRLGVIK